MAFESLRTQHNPEYEVRRLAKQTAEVLRELYGSSGLALIEIDDAWPEPVAAKLRDYCHYDLCLNYWMETISSDQADKALEEILAMWIWEVRYGT